MFACALVATTDTESSGPRSGSNPGVADAATLDKAGHAHDTQLLDTSLGAMTSNCCKHAPWHSRNVYERLQYVPQSPCL